jgi:gliding motility-associated-like protein
MGTLMEDSLAEKITVVPGDGCSLWVIVRRRYAAEFLAYQITNAGVSTVPVKSSFPGTFTTCNAGVLKAAPDMKKIVNQNAGGTGSNGTEVFDFNLVTGVLSGRVQLNNYDGCYGADFSPSGRVLYVTTGTSSGQKVYQYNLLTGAEYLVTSTPFQGQKDMRLGPDSKIYFGSVTASSNPYLDCIANPDALGAACAYVDSVVNLSPNNCVSGLPSLYWNVSGITPITGSSTVCEGTTSPLSNPVTGGTWSSSNTTVATIGITTGVVTGVAAGTAIITYTTTCWQQTMVITVNPITPIAGSASICKGATSALSNGVPGGTWSSSNVAVGTINAIGIVRGMDEGTTTISYVLPSGCFRTLAVTVSLAPIITGLTKICVGKEVTLSAIPGGTWASSSPGVATIGLTSGIVLAVAAGNSLISYRMPSGCWDTLTFTAMPAPTVGTINGPSVLCVGGKTVLTNAAGGGVWFSVDSSVIKIDSPVVTPGAITAIKTGTSAILYTVTLGSCSADATHSITVVPDPFTVDSSITHVKCNGGKDGAISLSIVGPPYQALWNSNLGSSLSISGLDVGLYTIQIKDLASSCVSWHSYAVNQPAPIKATPEYIVKDSCRVGSGAIKLAVTGGTMPYTYKWFNNTTSDEVTGLVDGVYSVQVTDMNGCVKDSSFTVEEAICSSMLVPDVFTPNGDGINDRWNILGILAYPNCNVIVFNKWGDIVFEETGYKSNWDGIGKSGNALPDGTYYYIIKLNEPNRQGGDNIFKGSLLIKR